MTDVPVSFQRFATYALGLILLTTAPLLTGCDTTASVDRPENPFSLTIRDSNSSTTLNGHSFFIEHPMEERDETVFNVYLDDNDVVTETSASNGLFGTLSRLSLRPTTGTYPIRRAVSAHAAADPDAFTLFFAEQPTGLTPSGATILYEAATGSITITESSDTRLAGSFTVTARRTSSSVNLHPEDLLGRDVKLIGSFIAKKSNRYLNPNERVGFSFLTNGAVNR